MRIVHKVLPDPLKRELGVLGMTWYYEYMTKRHKLLRKIDWTIYLTTISVIAAVVSGIAAIKANQIAREAQSPRISAGIAYWYQTYALFGNDMCYGDNGNLAWDTTFIVAIDITNTGGKPTTVVEVQESNAQSPNSAVNISVGYEQFHSAETLDSWLQSNTAGHDPSLIGIGELDTSNVDYSGFPLDIDVGRTVRIVLQGYEFIAGDGNVPPDQILQILQQANWLSTAKFVFGDSQSETVSIQLVKPWEVVRTEPFTPKPCK